MENMKKFTAFVVLFLMSCHPKTFVIEEKNDDKFFLNQEVKRGYSDGILSKNPLIIINGEVFKYDENLDTIKIPLKKSRIESVNPVSYTHLDVYKRQTRKIIK